MGRFAWVMGLLGAVLLAVGIGFCVHTWRFIDRAQMASGVVTELVRSGQKLTSTTYKPRIRFEASPGETVEFVSSVGSAPSAYRVGEPVMVYFDPSDPGGARLRGFWELWGVSSVAGALGAVFLVLGAGLGLAKRFYAQKLAELRVSGDLVLATLDKVALDTGTTFNDRHPWRVHAHWEDPVTGQRHRFVSEMLWEDPSARMGQSPVRVYVDRGKPGRYAMDLS